MSFTTRISIFLCGVLPALSAPFADTYYADANRDLFCMPRSAAVAKSDEALNRDGTPNSNAAALALDSGTQLSLSYSGLYQNTASVSSAASVVSIGPDDAFAFSINYMLVPDIELTVFYPVDNAGNVIVPPESEQQFGSASEIFVHAGYAHRFALGRSANFAFGAAVNAERRRLPDTTGFVTGYGIGVDAGALIQFPRTGIVLGFTGRDLTTNYMNWSSTYSENAPPQVHFAIAWDKYVPYMYGRFRLSYTTLDLLGNEGINAVQYPDEVQDTTGTPEKPLALKPSDTRFYLDSRIGLEYSILNVVALRAGLSDASDWTFGAGVNLFKQRFSLDFAYLLHDLGGSYMLGLTYRW